MNSKVIAAIFSIGLLIMPACGPSEGEIRSTVVAELTASAPPITKTLKPSPTITITPTKRPTSTPVPTKTLYPTWTPIPGTINLPLRVGDFVTLEWKRADGKVLMNMSGKLNEVAFGEIANKLARQELDWLSYKTPLDGQEYLAVNVELEILNEEDNLEVSTLYPYWSLTLRAYP